MNCKNCETPLRTDYSYCSHCGAKIIRNRLTVKNLWYDITERYFNVDNTFLRTFWHLFTKPEVVIDGYISGIRKKYLNPVSYLGIALMLSGTFLFLLRKFFIQKMDFSVLGGSLDSEVGEKIMSFSLDFSSFVFLLYIPLITVIGLLLFNGKSHNLSEYMVTGIYSLAHFSILSFPINIAICLITPENYLIYSMWYILFMALFVIYVVNRIHGKSIGKSIAFLLIFGIGFMGVSILLNLIMILTGVISFQDLLPKN